MAEMPFMQPILSELQDEDVLIPDSPSPSELQGEDMRIPASPVLLFSDNGGQIPQAAGLSPGDLEIPDSPGLEDLVIPSSPPIFHLDQEDLCVPDSPLDGDLREEDMVVTDSPLVSNLDEDDFFIPDSPQGYTTGLGVYSSSFKLLMLTQSKGLQSLNLDDEDIQVPDSPMLQGKDIEQGNNQKKIFYSRLTKQADPDIQMLEFGKLKFLKRLSPRLTSSR